MQQKATCEEIWFELIASFSCGGIWVLVKMPETISWEFPFSCDLKQKVYC